MRIGIQRPTLLAVLVWTCVASFYLPYACVALVEQRRSAGSLSALGGAPKVALDRCNRDNGDNLPASNPMGGGQKKGEESLHHCKPRYVHLSPTGDDGSVRLTWQTSKQGCSSAVRYKRTRWFGSPGGLKLSFRCTFFSCTATGEEAMFDAEMDCYSMENECLGWEPKLILYRHTVVLDRLVAGRIEYQYDFESESHDRKGYRWLRTFNSPPRSSPDSRLEFVVFGDMGAPTAEKCPGSYGTIKALEEEVAAGDTDIVFHNGDISYADGSPAIWDDFQHSIEPISSTTPYAITVGNHDYGWLPGIGKRKHHHSRVVDASGLERPYLPSWGNFSPDSKGECGYPLVNRFIMPQSRHSKLSSRAPFWYSVRMGPAHFVVLSGEHDLSAGSEQRAWMDSEFEAIRSFNTSWVIVLIHRPLYVVLPHKSNRVVGEHLADMLEDTFIKQKVSLVVSGHVHSMSRSCPLLKGTCVREGITYITLGSGGKELSAVDDPEDQPEWLASAQLVFGFGRFQIMNQTHMLFEYVESESGAGRVIDTVVINSRR